MTSTLTFHYLPLCEPNFTRTVTFFASRIGHHFAPTYNKIIGTLVSAVRGR